MREDGSRLWVLVGLSFAYGVFHAAGPGHGKAVISSYMLASEVALRRGIVLSFVSAVLKAVTALLVMALVFLVLRGTSVSMTDATWFLEVVSYVLITLFGAWLLWQKAGPRLLSLFGAGPAHSLSAAHSHDHGHSHHGHAHDHHHHGHHAHSHAHEHAHGHVTPQARSARPAATTTPDPAMLWATASAGRRLGRRSPRRAAAVLRRADRLTSPPQRPSSGGDVGLRDGGRHRDHCLDPCHACGHGEELAVAYAGDGRMATAYATSRSPARPWCSCSALLLTASLAA